MINSSKFRAAEWVQVRSKAEILRTLDQRGRLEGLPFMPEMFELCGKRLRVSKRAHKTCDPPSGTGGRQMLNAVHLDEVRCNGAAHDGCQAKCLFFWKDAWLQPAESAPKATSSGTAGCSEESVYQATQKWEAGSKEPVYVCQSTELRNATRPLRSWDLRQYAEDFTSGNVSLGRLVKSFLFFAYSQVEQSGLGVGFALRWAYDKIQQARGLHPYPLRVGSIPQGARTPTLKLDLKPGELVKVRSQAEILATINQDANNRGMSFDPEMVLFCDKTYRVLDRVINIINEKTGKMQRLHNDCIMLEGVVCEACYAKHRRFCPRSIYPYWREIWLDRVENPAIGAEDQQHARRDGSVF